MKTRIESEHVDAWVRAKAEVFDTSGQMSGANFDRSFALGILQAQIAWALTDPKKLREWRKELAAAIPQAKSV